MGIRTPKFNTQAINTGYILFVKTLKCEPNTAGNMIHYL